MTASEIAAQVRKGALLVLALIVVGGVLLQPGNRDAPVPATPSAVTTIASR